jgi:hypothetical protein
MPPKDTVFDIAKKLFEKEGVRPILIIGLTQAGTLRMACPFGLRSILQQETQLRESISATIQHGLDSMIDSPLDDLEMRG